MTHRSLALLAIVLVLVPAAAVPGVSSEPTQEVLAVYSENWYVTSEPLDGSYLDSYNRERIYVSENPEDPAFHSYIRGEIPRSGLSHPDIEESGSYYVFFISGSVLSGEAFGRIRLDLLDHSVVNKPSPTAMLLEEGLYNLETDGSVNDKVTVKGGSIISGYEPVKDGKLEILVEHGGTYGLMLNSGEWCCLSFKVVSGDVRTLPRMSGTVPYEIATPCHWARGEFDLGAGDYMFNAYVFPADSDEDAKFRTEVAEQSKTAAPDWADSWLRQHVDGRTRMCAYRLVSEEDLSISMQLLEGDRMVSNNTVHIEKPERIGPEVPRKLVLFAPAHETVSVAFSYDPSQYAVMMDWGEGAAYAAPDCRYDLRFDKSHQIDVTVVLTVSSVAGPDRFSATVLMSSENIPDPDGWGPALTVVCAGLCAAVLLALVWLGMRRRNC